MASIFSTMANTQKYKSSLMQNSGEVLEKTRPEAENATLTKVIELAKSAPTHDFEALDAALKDRQAVLASLFPIEADARAKVTAQISELTGKHNIAKVASKYDGKYLPVSMDVLKWRTADGLPKLAIFSLKDPKFMISSESEFTSHVKNPSYKKTDPQAQIYNNLGQANALANSGVMSYYTTTIDTNGNHEYYHYSTYVYPSDIPHDIRSLYHDVVEKLRKRARDMRSSTHTGRCQIGATFNGVIPDSTRTKIKEAQAVFSDIFILAEPQFSYHEELVPIPVDPIVLGWDGQQLWYVDDFDTTPVEEAALLQPIKV